MLKALLVAATIAGAPAQQFDLVCSGSAVTNDPNGAFDHKDARLRVDLASKKWCEDPPADYTGPVEPCAVLHEIAEVQPGLIIFTKETDEERVRGLLNSRVVSRTTGDYVYVHEFRVLDRLHHVAVASHCEPAPFSGFPKVETKF